MPKMTKKLSVEVSNARGVFETWQNELQDKFDNHSETWQESDKGQEMSAFIDDLQSVLDAIDVVDRSEGTTYGE